MLTKKEIFIALFGFSPTIGLECVKEEFWDELFEPLHKDVDAELKIAKMMLK